MTAEFRPDSRWTHAQGRRHHAFTDDVRDGNDSGADEFFFVQMADTQLGMQDQFRKGMGAYKHTVRASAIPERQVDRLHAQVSLLSDMPRS